MQQNVKETEPMLESTDACNSQKYSFRIQIIHGDITNITNHIIKSSTCNQNIYILASPLLQNRMSRNDSFVPANDEKEKEVYWWKFMEPLPGTSQQALLGLGYRNLLPTRYKFSP